MYVKLDYDPYDSLPDLNTDVGLKNKGIDRYLNVEALSMPDPSYFDNKSAEVWRERAVIVIFNVSMREDLEPFIPYLAVNYFDRYISRGNPLPIVMKYRQNDLELLSICCLTLAYKMRDKDFSMIEFRGRHSELADVTPEKFLTMELHILRGIDWHLRAVTPLCFVRFFAPKFDSTYGFRCRTINQIIINAQNDFKKTRFRPSVMAASAFLAASSFLYPEQFQSFVDKMTSLEIFKEGDLLKCVKGLIRQCKELNTMIESAVAENEYIPRKEVRAEGEMSEDEEEITIRATPIDAPQRLRQRNPRPLHKQATETSPETSAAAESRREAGETSGRANTEEKSKEVAAEEPKQVASKPSEKLKELADKESKQTTCEEPKQAVERSPENDADEKSKRKGEERSNEIAGESCKDSIVEETEESKDVAEESTKLAAEEAKQVGAQSSAATRKGKEKVSEVEMTEIPKMAEENEDVQMGFALRWRLGETNAGNFVIFTDIFESRRAGRGRANPAASLPQGELSLREKLQLFCEFCCFCCCCGRKLN